MSQRTSKVGVTGGRNGKDLVWSVFEGGAREGDGLHRRYTREPTQGNSGRRNQVRTGKVPPEGLVEICRKDGG